jgi:hypothetical protein
VLIRDIPERVERDHRGKLLARAYDDRSLDPEPARDLSLEFPREAIRGNRGGEHDVAGLHESTRVAVAKLGEQTAQIRHRDALVRPEVDGAKESDLAGHDRTSLATDTHHAAGLARKHPSNSSLANV